MPLGKKTDKETKPRANTVDARPSKNIFRLSYDNLLAIYDIKTRT
jgi:hypothetical protein